MSIFTKAFAQKTDKYLTRLKRLETGELRLRRGGLQYSAGEFSRGSALNLEDGDIFGGINLRSADVRKLGSLPPTVVDAFTVIVTDTVASIYYDGTNGSSQIQIRRTDESYLVVPPGNLIITGLTALTKYYALPFWSTDAEGDTCGLIGWVAGDSGSPQFAMTEISLDQLAAQTQQGREPLAHPSLSFTMAAGGGGPTSSFAGGGGSTSGTVRATTGRKLFDPDLP